MENCNVCQEDVPAFQMDTHVAVVHGRIYSGHLEHGAVLPLDQLDFCKPEVDGLQSVELGLPRAQGVKLVDNTGTFKLSYAMFVKRGDGALHLIDSSTNRARPIFHWGNNHLSSFVCSSIQKVRPTINTTYFTSTRCNGGPLFSTMMSNGGAGIGDVIILRFSLVLPTTIHDDPQEMMGAEIRQDILAMLGCP